VLLVSDLVNRAHGMVAIVDGLEFVGEIIGGEYSPDEVDTYSAKVTGEQPSETGV
jgi:hypothetical protein